MHPTLHTINISTLPFILEESNDKCLRDKKMFCNGAMHRSVINDKHYYYYYYYYYYMDVSFHRPILPDTSLEPAVISTAQASSFTLQYFPYYV
jgi:hypothetical protein